MGDKEAFCLLLWSYQGGRINAKGLPISTPGARISGYCDNPNDCYRCPLMQREIQRHPEGHANWVCPDCLKEISRLAKIKGVSIHMTAHYTEGQCQFVGCTRPPRVEYDSGSLGPAGTDDEVEGHLMGQPKWSEADLVERPRGFSRFLQLVIGDINT